MPTWGLDANGNLQVNNDNYALDAVTYAAEDYTTNTNANNYRFYTTNTLNARDWEPMPITTDYVTQEQLEKFANKLYKIIEEHTHIDITEEEFMDLLLKDDD